MIPKIVPQTNAIASYVKHSRPFFQIGLCLILTGVIFSFFQTTFQLFSLTGNDLVRFEIWRLFTHFALELNVFAFTWSLWSLHQAVAIIEPSWGSCELTKYLAVVQIGSAVAIAILALLTFAVTKNDSFFFRTNIYGSLSACSAVYVAIKQYLPDSILLTTPVGRIKNTHLPACIVLCASILIALGLLRWISLLQILLGIQIGWTYLRFFQPHDDGEPKGDPSEHFAWATFFPSKVQPFLKVISSAAYICMLRAHLCKPLARHIDLTQLDSINIILPGLQTKDTERRRQKALRDLTERLNRVQRAETDMWPEMEDVDQVTAHDTSSAVVRTGISIVQQNEIGSESLAPVEENINAEEEHAEANE